MDATYYNGEPRAEHDPNLRVELTKYRCECGRRFHGGLAAHEHHKDTHHRMTLPNDVQVVFGCCALHVPGKGSD